MRIFFRRYAKVVIGLFATIAMLSLMSWVTGSGLQGPAEAVAKMTGETAVTESSIPVFDSTNPHVQEAMAVKARHTPRLMALPDVVGTAVGLTETGQPAIVVFAKTAMRPGLIPGNIEGKPVIVHVSGEFTAMARPSAIKIDPTARFARPVPIGVSTGNEGECSAGTIGARVKDGDGNVYALSNNHVYALENNAPIGSRVLQPGLYDTGCTFKLDNVIGTLSDFEPLDFSGGANMIDAAIALSLPNQLGNATPSNGYGTPKSATVGANLNAAVQKYGRTTSLTKGRIYAINGTVKVTYSSGTATFVDQIFVTSSKPFIKAGDSGSLLVTDPGRNPVGLLFAGNSSGTFAVASPIDAVLSAFGVSIDGE